ncbi:MAG TPA: hypothetical protein P5299_01555 [Candidatus Woesebacteria bacterium]|nr:hypothetical protein [Candidatus Woesebacteria bacterium]
MGLKDDIKKTIAYAKTYGCVLNKKQLYERLIGKNNYELKITSYEFKHLKLRKAQQLAERVGKMFPNVLFIGVTGSVAAEFPKRNDDIDLFIIVKNNTLWLTRFWLRIFIWQQKIPHRRYGRKEKADEFCFNIWLDESALLLPPQKQNLNNAVDLILMKKIYDKNNTYIKFIQANSWAKKYVATPYCHLIRNSKFKIQNDLPKILNFKLKILNLLYFLPQYLYSRLKTKPQNVDLHRAFWGGSRR